MSKTFLIIFIIIALTSGVIWYFSKHSVDPISKQLDLKSGSTHINWIIWKTSFCDTSKWSCKDYDSDSYSSSTWWWGGWWGGK